MKTGLGHAAAGLAALMLAIAPSIVVAQSTSDTGSHAATQKTAADKHASPSDPAHQAAQAALAGKPVQTKEDRDYQDAVKKCKKLPRSERTTCMSEAGNATKLSQQAHREVPAKTPQ